MGTYTHTHIYTETNPIIDAEDKDKQGTGSELPRTCVYEVWLIHCPLPNDSALRSSPHPWSIQKSELAVSLLAPSTGLHAPLLFLLIVWDSPVFSPALSLSPSQRPYLDWWDLPMGTGCPGDYGSTGWGWRPLERQWLGEVLTSVPAASTVLEAQSQLWESEPGSHWLWLFSSCVLPEKGLHNSLLAYKTPHGNKFPPNLGIHVLASTEVEAALIPWVLDLALVLPCGG